MIRENAVIIRATHADHETSVGNGNFIMTGARLSHDVTVGNRCIIGNGSQISGNCIVFDCSILTSNVLMQGNTRLGSYSVVQGGCRFVKDIPPYIVAAHEPIEFYSISTLVLERAGFSETLSQAHCAGIPYFVQGKYLTARCADPYQGADSEQS